MNSLWVQTLCRRRWRLQLLPRLFLLLLLNAVSTSCGWSQTSVPCPEGFSVWTSSSVPTRFWSEEPFTPGVLVQTQLKSPKCPNQTRCEQRQLLNYSIREVRREVEPQRFSGSKNKTSLITCETSWSFFRHKNRAFKVPVLFSTISCCLLMWNSCEKSLKSLPSRWMHLLCVSK